MIANVAPAAMSASSTAPQTVAIIPCVVDLSNALPSGAKDDVEEGAIVVEGEVDEELTGGDDEDVEVEEDNEGDDKIEDGNVDELAVVEDFRDCVEVVSEAVVVDVGTDLWVSVERTKVTE